jgi:hypothetical protein
VPITGDFTLVMESGSGMPIFSSRYRLDTATRRLNVEEEGLRRAPGADRVDWQTRRGLVSLTDDDITAVRTAVEKAGLPGLERSYRPDCTDTPYYHATLSQPGLPDLTTTWFGACSNPRAQDPPGYACDSRSGRISCSAEVYPRALGDLVTLVEGLASSPLLTPSPSP